MWKKIDEDPRYWVSDNGAVKGTHGKALSQHRDRNGYLTVRIAGNTRRVHKLVAEAFLGPRPVGYQVAHLDGNPANNGVENLTYCTAAENIGHKVGHGTMANGSRNGNSRLKESQVLEIKQRLASGELCSTIALDYGVAEGTIDHIRQGRTWKHL